MKPRMDDWYRDADGLISDHLSDLVALATASDAEALWRALVVPVGRSTTDHFMAVHLLRRLHEDGAPGALTTALLLCTDGRWDRCTARLIAGIADASILDEESLDELAARFLWSDYVRFEFPVSWIGTEWVGVDLDGDGAVDSPVMHLDADTPVPTERRIAPPLRRWAAARILGSDPGAFARMRERAVELGARDGGAVLSGILDAVDVLDDEVARYAIDIGLGWSIGSVRLLALDLLATGDLEAARRRAAGDPDAKVRRWTPRRARTAAGQAREEGGQPTSEQRRGRPEPLSAQAELFPE